MPLLWILIALLIAGCGTPPRPLATVEAPLKAQNVRKIGGTGRPVLMLHGRDGSSENFVTMGGVLTRAGYSVYFIDLLPNDETCEMLAWQLYEAVERIRAEKKTETIDIVSHSMGSLISRYFIKELGGDKKIERLVMLASPHHGTYVALAPTDPAAIQLRPNSDFLKELNAGDETPGDILYTNIFSMSDPNITPDTSAWLSGAENHVLRGPSHSGILEDPQAIALVQRGLARKR